MTLNRLESFIDPMIAMAATQFPRQCGNCRRQFSDFKQYIQETRPIGPPTLMQGAVLDPIHVISWTNCTCGSTLVLFCVDAAEDMHERFIRALEAESAESRRPIDELLQLLRAEVRRRVLSS